MRGNFIVLEGIDGCGKSTQIERLSNWLPKSGLMPKDANLFVTREPGGTALGLALRALLLHPPGKEEPEPITELLLYAADRAQHVSQFIRPKLEQGHWILSDRFSGSTIAYQGYGREINLELIQQLESIATSGLSPDITLWLDLPVKESLSRRGTMPQDRIEAEGANFLERVANGFAILSKERNWVQMKADIDISDLSREIECKLIMHLQKSESMIP